MNSYGPKQVAAWIAAKLVSAKYDASEIQQARGVNFVCTIHSFSLLQALAKLTGMLSEQLLEVTQDEFESQYNLEAAKAKFLFNAAQGLSDPSATLACTSHASFGGPVLWSVSRQLACFTATRALKGIDLSRPRERQQLSRVQIPACLGVQAPNRHTKMWLH